MKRSNLVLKLINQFSIEKREKAGYMYNRDDVEEILERKPEQVHYEYSPSR